MNSWILYYDYHDVLEMEANVIKKYKIWLKKNEVLTWMVSIGFSLSFRFLDLVVVFFGVDGIIGSVISNGNFFLPREGVARIFVMGRFWNETDQ